MMRSRLTCAPPIRRKTFVVSKHYPRHVTFEEMELAFRQRLKALPP
jgi:hypothetical protein